MQIRAEIDRVSYRNEDNGWTVLKARNYADESVFTATGHFAAVRQGDQYEFFGSWSNNAKYGPQFKIDRCVPVRPTSAAAIERYLSSGLIKGIGPKTAERIVAYFGEKTLEILDKDPKALLAVPSIGAKKAEAIIDSWDEQRGVADVMMFLNTHGISPLFASRIFKAYGTEAIKTVSADPYKLATDINGIGFISADKIAQSMGIAADSFERMRAAVLYTLQQAEEKGHCYITTPQLTSMLVETLRLAEERIIPRLADAIAYLNDLGALSTEQVTTDEGKTIPAYFRTDLLVAEYNVSTCVKQLMTHTVAAETDRIEIWLKRYAEASGTSLSDEQLEAVKRAVTSRVFVLTGGPGVGKTTTANCIIRLLKAMGRSVALGAPTGRAAQRLTEVAAAPAKTIHRLLEWQPHLAGFSRDETNPLTVQAVIIDEASMLDIRLMDALIRAVPHTAQLILIGDVDQLPSVGPGNVLRDFIDSGVVPYTRLTRIFRQASYSRIIRAAHMINGGEKPELDDDPKTDCQFIEVDSGDEIKVVIRDLVTRRLPHEFGFDPVTQTQVLTPMNRGDLGTQVLNEGLQEILNPLGKDVQEFKRGSLTLRPGDKVIQTTNNYDLGVFNGDIGYVQHTKVEGGKLMVAFGEERIVTYEHEHVLDLRLAYAITIHKSQGSEFPVVIIPMSMTHYVMLQRNLIYTALTRAKRLAIFVGSKKTLSFAIGNSHSSLRQTTLIEKLRKSE